MQNKLFLIFFSCCLLVNCRDVKKEKALKEKHEVTTFLINLDGKNVSLNDYKGKEYWLIFGLHGALLVYKKCLHWFEPRKY